MNHEFENTYGKGSPGRGGIDFLVSLPATISEFTPSSFYPEMVAVVL
jgi:hypothetical protein